MRNAEQHPDWLSAHWAGVQSVLSLLHGFIKAPYLHCVHVVPVTIKVMSRTLAQIPLFDTGSEKFCDFPTYVAAIMNLEKLADDLLYL